MPNVKPIIILGAGGTCVDIADILQAINDASAVPRYECIGFLDDNESTWRKTIGGVPVLGPLERCGEYPHASFVSGIGNPDNYWRAAAIVARTGIPPERFETLAHPSAAISRSARIGTGTVLFAHVTVGANARIGNHVLVLSNAVVNHDCTVEDYTYVTTGASLSGHVRIGKGCYIGTNSAIRQGVSIGDHCLVGMGSVVLRDVPARSVVAGNPARRLREIAEAGNGPPPTGMPGRSPGRGKEG